MANKKNLKKISSKRKTEKMNEKSSISALPQTDLAMAETMAMIAAWKLVGAEAVNRAAANETVEFRGDKVHYDKKVKESLLENYKALMILRNLGFEQEFKALSESILL